MKRCKAPGVLNWRLLLLLLTTGWVASTFAATDPAAAPALAYRTYGTWHSGEIGGGGFVQFLVLSPSDPNRDYLTTDVGGLYRSDDSGRHWHMLSGSFPADAGSYSARGLLVAPDNADHLIAAMGAGQSSVNGICLSPDGGKTWNQTLKVRFDGNGDYRMCGPILLISSADPRTLYCAAIETGVYRSRDAGQTWQHIGPSEPVQPTGLLIDRGHPAHLWMTNANFKFDSGPSRKGLFFSPDDGNSWEMISPWAPEKIIQDPADPGVLIAATERDSIRRSTDGGRTWSPMSDGIPPYEKDRSWSKPGTINALAASGNDLIAGAQSGDFYRFDRPTRTWQKIIRQGVDEQDWWGRMGPGRGQHFGQAMSHMGVDPADARHWWFTDWYALYQTYDSGQHWTLTLDGIEMLCFHCVRQDPAIPQTVHTGAADLGYFRSDNGGQSYRWITNGINNNIKDIRLCPSNPDRMVAVGPSGGDWLANQVFISRDHGLSWTRSSMKGLPDMNQSRCNTIAVMPNQPDHVFLAVSDEVKPGGGGVYESTDGAQTWAWKGQGLPVGKTFFHKDIWVSGPELDVSADGSMVATSNDHHQVYFWDKPASQWIPARQCPANAQPNTLIADTSTPGRFYLAANQAGLLRSDNGGADWQVVSHLPVSSLTIDVTNPNRLAAITPDDVLLTDNAGTNWTSIGATLPYRAARNVAGFAGNRLVVATSGCGTFWTDLTEAAQAGHKIAEIPPAKVDAQAIQYRQWSDAIRLSNGTVELVIVPDLDGRIMRYGFVGGPNVLWECPPDSLHSPLWGDWTNWGGDKPWPWPQSEWKSHSKHDWPPPPEFDQIAVTAKIVDSNRVEISSPAMPHFEHRQYTRSISLDPTGTTVHIETRLSPPAHPPADTQPAAKAPLPVGSWEIAQAVWPDQLLIHNATISAVEQPKSNKPGAKLFATTSWSATPLPAPTAKSLWQLTPTLAGQAEFCLTDADALASIHARVAFIQHREPVPAPPGIPAIPGENCRLYIEDRPTKPEDRYVELEWIAPRVPAESNSPASVLKTDWSLAHVPPSPLDPATAAALLDSAGTNN